MEHYLYTIEFLVQNLTITKGNICAPQSYPVNAEFKFRRGLFVSIPQSDFGAVVDKTNPPRSSQVSGYYDDYEYSNDRNNRKSGRCCAFTLDRPLDSNEALDIRVYKKKSDKCKFLIGMAELPLSNQFQELMDKFFALNKGQFYNTLKQRHRDVAGSPATPYPPSGTPKHPEYGSTEAEVEERRTKKLPDENEATFKPEDGQDSFGIHTDPNPIQPDKQANVVFKASIQLRNNRGEGSAFMVVLIRLACMGRTVCTEIPFPKKDGGGAHHRQMSIESKESHKLDPFGESSMDDSGSLEDGRFYSDRPQSELKLYFRLYLHFFKKV